MRILFVDDHQLVREALTYYLKSSDPGIDVVEAGSLAEALNLSNATEFDLVLLDYRLPGISGNEAVEAACRHFAETPVIVLSGAIPRDEAQAALRRGAAGVISKDIEGRRLMDTVRGILEGDIQISGLLDPPYVPTPESGAKIALEGALSNRERQVAHLLAAGLSNKEIAKSLGIADITVRLHLRQIFRKLGARSRTDAVRIILTHPTSPGP